MPVGVRGDLWAGGFDSSNSLIQCLMSILQHDFSCECLSHTWPTFAQQYLAAVLFAPSAPQHFGEQ